MSQYASARNRKSGCAAFVRPIRVGQYSSCGAGPARSPHVRAKTSLVISIAMSQRSPSHCAADRDQGLRDGLAQSGRERIELRHVGPRGEVRVATLGHHAARGAQERLGVAREVLLGAGQQALGTRGGPRMVGGDVVGHVVEDHAQAPGGELLARRRQRRGTAEALVHDVVAHAVGRADHVLGAQVREGGAVGRVQGRVLQGDPQACRAALPDAHQPDGVDGQRRERIPLGGGHLVERERPPALAAEALQPHRGVDLVDGRAARQAHDASRSAGDAGGRAGLRAHARRGAGRAAPRSRSTRSDGWRRCRHRCRRGSTRGRAAGRASAGRAGTSRCRRTPAGARPRPR